MIRSGSSCVHSPQLRTARFARVCSHYTWWVFAVTDRRRCWRRQRVAWLDIGGAILKWTAWSPACEMQNIARQVFPATGTWGKVSRSRRANDRLVLCAHLVLCVVICGGCKPAMLAGRSAMTRSIVCLKLGPNVSFIRTHLIVSPLRREAAAVSLVQDLHLVSLRLETGKKILARIIACAECPASRLQLRVGVRVG